MDDSIKKGIEGYKPEFREEYWKEAERMLDNRKKKRGFIWWPWGLGIAVLIAAATIVLYKSHKDDTKDAIVIQKGYEKDSDPSSKNLRNENAAKLNNSKENKSVTEERTSQSISSPQINTEENSNSKLNNRTISIESLIEPPTRTDKINDSKSTNDVISSNERSILSDDMKNASVVTFSSNGENHTNNHDQISKSIKNAESAIPQRIDKTIASIPFTHLGYLMIEDTKIEQTKPMPIREIKKHNKQKIHSRLIASLGYAATSGSQNEIISNGHVNVQRSIETNKFFSSIGVGFSAYRGDFVTTDSKTTSYRNFVSSSYTQTQRPDAFYYIQFPLSVGLKTNQLQYGLTFKPELLLEMHGELKNINAERSLVNNNTGQLDGNYAVSTMTSEESITTYLEQTNLNRWNLPMGFYGSYSYSDQLSIGMSLELFAGGLMSLNRSVLGNNHATGRNQNLKGGIYVQYKF